MDVSFVMRGDNFSPTLLERKTGWTLSRKDSYLAVLSPPTSLSNNDDREAGLKWIVEKVGDCINTVKQCGAEDNYLDIAVYYIGQCNMAFEPYLLRKISELNVPFWISCYEDYDDGLLS
jgi:hypothetical protein